MGRGSTPALNQTSPVSLSQKEALDLLALVRDARAKLISFEKDGALSECMQELRRPENWIDVREDMFDARLLRDISDAGINGQVNMLRYIYDTAQKLLACVADIERAKTIKMMAFAGTTVLVAGTALYFLLKSS